MPATSVTTPLSSAQPHCGNCSTRAAIERKMPNTMNATAINTVKVSVAISGFSMNKNAQAMYSSPTSSSSKNPLHLPAQNELMIMATPSTIRITPSTTGTAIDVATITGGKTIVSVPPTTNNTPKSMNHHQRDARCSSSWRTSPTTLVAVLMV